MNRLTTLGKALVVFFTGLAIAAVVTLVSARSSSREAAGAAHASGALSARAQATDDLSADDTASGAAPTQVAFVVFAPSHGSSPRIIHVPRSGERDREASANSGDEAVATIEQDDGVPPPPRHRVIPLPRRSDAPAPQHRAAAPAAKRQADIAPNMAPNMAPLAPHRDVTIMQKLKPPAAQPQPAGETDAKLTPVYPTPRYDNKLETVNGTADGPSATAPVPPPVGYAPPSGLPYRSN